MSDGSNTSPEVSSNPAPDKNGGRWDFLKKPLNPLFRKIQNPKHQPDSFVQKCITY